MTNITDKTDSYETLYARQTGFVKTLQEQVKDLEYLCDKKNEKIRALSHQNITLKNHLHGIARGEVTITQALEAAETPVSIEVS